MTDIGSKENGYAATATNRFDGSPPQLAGLIGPRKEYEMKHKGEKPVAMEEVPPEARHTLRGLERWLLEHRWSRGIPEKGLDPLFHVCSESCTLHDHES